MIDEKAELDAQIQDLAARYVNAISWDHHKSKDYRFYVEVKWYAGEGAPTFAAQHWGYINEIEEPVERSSLVEAMRDLRDFLIKCHAGMREWAEAGLGRNDPEEWTRPEDYQRVLDALDGK